MMRMVDLRIALAVLPVLFFPACDESLPPRTDPDSVLVPSIDMSGTLVRVEAGQVTSGGNIQLSMSNVFDEVLSEAAGVRAFVGVSLQEYPGYSRLLVLDERDIVTPGFIVGNTLTLGVHDTITLMHPWDHRVDTSAAFWNAGMSYQRLVTDKGIEYYQSPPVHLVVDASLQIFKRVPAVQLPRRVFTIVYQLWRMKPPVTP